MDSTMLIVGSSPQFFFDNLVIEQVQDLTKTVHSPEKAPGPLIKKDRAWERTPYITMNGWSVLRDQAAGEFKFWYEDWTLDPREVLRQKVFYCAPAVTSLAVSRDGLQWEKPLVGCDQDGRRTNAVLGGRSFEKLESICVFEDTLDVNPQRRFKMMLTHYVRADARRSETSALTLHEKMDGAGDDFTDEIRIEMHCSAEGIHWEPMSELPRFGRDGGRLGDVCMILPDEETGMYRLITRAAGMCSVHVDARRPVTNSFFAPTFPHDPGRMNKRRIYLSESPDLIHWSTPQCILAPYSEMDNLDDSYYGMVPFKVGDIYLGLLNVLHEVPNTMDIQLVYSRDGWRWHHLARRDPWLTVSPGSWDACMVNISSPPIPVGDEMFVFYGGASCHHDWWIVGLLEGLDVPEAHDLSLAKYGLGLSKMRRDGFVSVDANAVREGILVTRVLRTEARQLVLNAACGKNGYIEVEATDADEQVLEGCSRMACDAFSGDSTKAVVTWKGRAEVPHDGSLRLRFSMRNASLYSFAFA